MNKKIITLLIIFLMVLYIKPFKLEAISNIRIMGQNRYETSIEISKYGYSGSSDYVILSRGDEFADGLCAAPLAKKLNAPLLLTDTNILPNIVFDEIKRLRAKYIIIIGGEGAVSKNIEEFLISNNLIVDRIAGKDRYETSIKIAERLGSCSSIAVATGENYPDALSISPIAANLCMPIILTQYSNIPECVNTYLLNYPIKNSFIIGGIGVISDSIIDLFPNPKRISGNNRYETNIEVLMEFEKYIKFDNIFITVADGPYGDEFADALSGSVLAGKNYAPMIFVYKTLPSVASYYLKEHINDNSKVIGLGGEGAVPSCIMDNILDINNKNSTVFLKAINAPKTVGLDQVKVVSTVTDPYDAEICAYSSNNEAFSVSVSGKNVTITGKGSGSALITIVATYPDKQNGIVTFKVASPVYNKSKQEYYNKIQDAIDNASIGDEIRISSGVYKEHLIINKSLIKLIGEDKYTTIIDAAQTDGITRAGIKIKDYCGASISNFTIKNAGYGITSEDTKEPYGIYVNSSDQNVFDNLILEDNGLYGIYIFEGCDNNIVKNCIIKGGDNTLDGIFSCGGEINQNSYSLINYGNKFINNYISNIVYGISLTASYYTDILENNIEALSKEYFNGYTSACILISNGSYNNLDKNILNAKQDSIRISTLSDISPYSYAGYPSHNKISYNKIISDTNGIKICGSDNTIEINDLDCKDKAIYIVEASRDNTISYNNIYNSKNGIYIENVMNEIKYNKFKNCEDYVFNSTLLWLNAKMNYYDNNPKGKNSSCVSYSPWILDGEDLDLNCIGYQKPKNVTWGVDFDIQSAIDISIDGDIIRVRPNIYNLSKALVINKAIALIGPNYNIEPKPSLELRTDEAILNGSNLKDSIIYINADNVEINGFTIMNAYKDLIKQENMHLGTQIAYNIFKDSNGTNGIYIKDCLSALIEHNYFKNITLPGKAIYLDNSPNCLIIENIEE